MVNTLEGDHVQPPIFQAGLDREWSSLSWKNLCRGRFYKAAVPHLFGTGFVEDDFSTDGGGWGAGGGSGSNESNGERQMKLRLLAPPLTSCCAARFLTGCGLLPVRGPGIGDPCYKAFSPPLSPRVWLG